jgi:hypothetical protein
MTVVHLCRLFNAPWSFKVRTVNTKSALLPIAAGIVAVTLHGVPGAQEGGTILLTRDVDQLTASQEQMTHEITKLQAVEQQVLQKNSERAPRPSSALARNDAAAVAGTDVALTVRSGLATSGA